MNFIQYNRSKEHDVILVQWYGQMMMDGEFYATFYKSMESLSTFLDWFCPPRSLFFKIEFNGSKETPCPLACAWFEPIMSAAGIGYWVRKDRRKSKLAVSSAEEAISIALKNVPSLITFTQRKELIKAHQRFGYNIAGFFPGLWDGKDVWAFTIDQFGFDHRKMRSALNPHATSISPAIDAIIQAET